MKLRRKALRGGHQATDGDCATLYTRTFKILEKIRRRQTSEET